MNNNKSIVMLPIEKLYPNPLNPRQNVGNCDELADSISAVGILQNLTVVPFDPVGHAGLTVNDPTDAYVVVIGHRRRQGAIQAGLTEVPCILESFTPSKQVGIMISENTEREDLTPYEEAMGYQMLLDLGETVETVAKETGISVATVRSRCKLLELDPEKFKAAASRGGTLSDYAELNKLNDPDLKNQVLEAIGTKNFRNELSRAIEKEKTAKWTTDALDKVQIFATELTEDPDREIYSYQFAYSWWNKKDVTTPEDADKVEYFFHCRGDYINIYTKKSQAETAEDAARKQRAQKYSERKDALEAASARAFDLRADFIHNFTNAKAKKYLDTICAFTCSAALNNQNGYYYGNVDRELLAEMLGIAYDKTEKSFDDTEFSDAIKANSARSMLCVGYALTDRNHLSYVRNDWVPDKGCWIAMYKSNDILDNIYSFLESIGYEMSDEEKALQNGTHEMFEQIEADPAQACA